MASYLFSPYDIIEDMKTRTFMNKDEKDSIIFYLNKYLKFQKDNNLLNDNYENLICEKYSLNFKYDNLTIDYDLLNDDYENLIGEKHSLKSKNNNLTIKYNNLNDEYNKF